MKFHTPCFCLVDFHNPAGAIVGYAVAMDVRVLIYIMSDMEIDRLISFFLLVCNLFCSPIICIRCLQEALVVPK